jgi:VCBS repeat-containing protein
VLSASGVTFTPANWNVPRTVTVTGVDDAAADGPVAFTVVTSATSSADAGYNGLAVADVSATNQDDDTGLRVTYFDNPDFTGTSVTRFDPTIDFNWAGGSPDPSIGADTFSARWRGEVRPQYGETYTFHTTSDDGVRLWVDGTLVLDNWTDHPSTVNTATITLAAGQWYPIRMELYENAGVAVAKLEWSSTSQARQVVPRARLRPTNVAPSAAGDGYTAGQGGVLTVDAGAGVLANDFDADADPISAVLVSGPAHGSFSLNADGSFTYTPNARFFGTDSFSYRLTDGTASSGVATVTLSVTRTAGITVTPAAGLTTTEAGGAASFSVVLDFAPAAPVTVQLISGAPGEGTLSQSVLTFDAGNWNVPRTVTVTGINDRTADGNVTYAISAAVTSADARYDGLAVPAVGVTNFDMPEPEPEPAGAPPVARDDAYRVDADGTLTVGDRSGVLRNDADPDGSPLTALLLDGPAHGTLTLLPGGGFVYAPEAGFAGVDGFRYVAGDGSDVSAPATVAITIIAADPAPRPVVLPPVTPAPTPSVPPGDNDLPPAPEPADAPAEGKKDDGSTIGVPPASPPPLTAAPARPESAQPDGAGELAHPPVAPPDSLEPAAPRGGKKPVTPVQPGGVPVAPIPDGDDPGFYPESGVPSLAMTRGASASLAVGLDAMSRQIGSRGPSESASVRAVRHTFVAITVGYVVWSLRGASLIASLLTSMPLWRSLDPLPILENRVSAAKRTRRRWFGRPRPGGNPEQPLGEMVK